MNRSISFTSIAIAIAIVRKIFWKLCHAAYEVCDSSESRSANLPSMCETKLNNIQTTFVKNEEMRQVSQELRSIKQILRAIRGKT